MASSITLFCWVLDKSECPFQVEIAKDKTVDHLKDAIKEKKPNTLIKVDARQLQLWNVSIPDDDQLEASIRQTMLGSPLRSTKLLSAVFPSPLPMDVVHVLIKCELASLCHHIEWGKFFPCSIVPEVEKAPCECKPAKALASLLYVHSFL
jgi:hypothetical protein